MGFDSYLTKRHSKATVKAYKRHLEQFDHYLNGRAKVASYEQIISYLSKERKEGKGVAYINTVLSALKKYYDYLLAAELRKDHPAYNIRLKDNKNKEINLSDLLTEEELEKLLERKERYPLLANRNKSIIGLLIYQGLKSKEISQLKIKDFDLEKGIVSVRAGNRVNGRVLKLRGEQVLTLYKYKEVDREKLLKEASDYFFIGMRGKQASQDAITNLVTSSKKLLPGKRISPTIIRQSVIANLLRQNKDLRVVQVFAGHKYPSSTEMYRERSLKELKEGIEKYHPF
ncbi:tyrosine-type recombinase/integrase [Chitinophagales bacterium]|nr:tyrosine-type recombinase/integrase [Chitinophagales bacterium]